MIQISLEYLRKAKGIFSLEDAIILYLLYLKEYEEVEKWTHPVSISDLLPIYQKAGLIKIIGENPEDLEFRQEFINLVPPLELDTTKEWIQEWLDLWPKGVKSGPHYVRSSIKDVLPKMQKFVKKYKFPKDVIIAATKKYLSERKSQNWTYTTCADYFILKDNISRLASVCENFKEKGSINSINEMI